MNKALLATSLLLACGLASAKLPAPQLDDAAKAKAAEAAAKTAWQAKVDAWQLCKAQDRVVASLGKGGGGAKAMPAKGGASAAAVAAKAAPAAQAPAAAAPAAAASGTTPVAGVGAGPAPIPPCLDPGPFAYNPPEQKPLETSGAHSPTGTATSPPSVKPNSADMIPGGKKKS